MPTLFDISGRLDVLTLSGFGMDHQYGLTIDGRPTGISRSTLSPLSFAGDTTSMDELSFQFTSKATRGPRYHGEFIIGNTIGTPTAPYAGFGSQSTPQPGTPFVSSSFSGYLQDLSMITSKTAHGTEIGMELGRFGERFGPLFLQRTNVAPYFVNERWNNGAYYLDGARFYATGKFGKATLVAATSNMSGSVFGFGPVQPLVSSAGAMFSTAGFTSGRPQGLSGSALFQVHNIVGLDWKSDIPRFGTAQLTYLKLGASSFPTSTTDPLVTPTLADSQQVYGLQVNGTVLGFPVRMAYAKSDLFRQSASINSKDNVAAYAEADANLGPVKGTIGFRQIDAQFGAPGDWGRIGDWWNPVGIKGSYTSLSYSPTRFLTLVTTADTQNGTGDGQLISYYQGDFESKAGLSSADTLTHYRVGVQLAPGAKSGLGVGADTATYSLAGQPSFGYPATSPVAHWYDVSYFYEWGDRSRLSVLFELSDYNSGNSNNTFEAFPGLNQPNAKGGLVAMQYTYRF